MSAYDPWAKRDRELGIPGFEKPKGVSEEFARQRYNDVKQQVTTGYFKPQAGKETRFAKSVRGRNMKRLWDPARISAQHMNDARMKLPGYAERQADHAARDAQIADQMAKVYGGQATPEMIAAEQARQRQFFDSQPPGLQAVSSGGQNYGPGNVPVYGKASPDAPQNQVAPPPAAGNAMPSDPALEAWKAQLASRRGFQAGANGYLQTFGGSMDPQRRRMLVKQTMYGGGFPFGNPYGF